MKTILIRFKQELQWIYFKVEQYNLGRVPNTDKRMPELLIRFLILVFPGVINTKFLDYDNMISTPKCDTIISSGQLSWESSDEEHWTKEKERKVINLQI